MPRLTNQQKVSQINEAINAAGGEIEHEALIDAVDEPTAQFLFKAAQRGMVNRRVVSQGDGTSKVLYTVAS